MRGLGRELWVYWDGNFEGIGEGTLGVLGWELMKGLGRELWVYWEGNYVGIGKGTYEGG